MANVGKHLIVIRGSHGKTIDDYDRVLDHDETTWISEASYLQMPAHHRPLIMFEVSAEESSTVLSSPRTVDTSGLWREYGSGSYYGSGGEDGILWGIAAVCAVGSILLLMG